MEGIFGGLEDKRDLYVKKAIIMIIIMEGNVGSGNCVLS